MSRAPAQRKPARVDAQALPGATAVPFPGFIQPSHPTLREEAPAGARWVHEIKFDGYRTQAHLQQGRPAIYTRRADDWTLRFRTIADALATLPADDLILDGEAVVADSRGVPDSGLKSGTEPALARRRQAPVAQYGQHPTLPRSSKVHRIATFRR